MGTPKIPDDVAHRDVQVGDTLWKIAVHQLGDGGLAGDLASLNKLPPGAQLQVGQRLIVPDFGRYDLTVAFMLSEMITNAKGGDAQAIAEALARSGQLRAEGDKAYEDMKQAHWYQVFRAYGDQKVFETMIEQSGLAMAEAKARWFLKVRQDGPWDHKPILRKKYEAMPTPPRPFGALGRAFHFPIRGDLFHEFYYDVWSNVHYGYVGARCGFDERTLQEGAASGLPGAGDNDEGDVISVKIGIDLWRSAGPALTEDKLRLAILAQTSTYLAARAGEIAKGVAASKATNVVITDNDYK